MKKKILKSNLFTLSGWLIGVISFGFAVYTYLDSIKKREPQFSLSEKGISLTDTFKGTDTPSKKTSRLSVFWQETNQTRKEVTGNVYLTRFYFWNDGKEAIKSENILSDLEITTSNPKVQILEANIIKTSRPEINRVTASFDNKRNSLKINFRILEQGDGFSGQIIYSGGEIHGLTFKGHIEGVPRVNTDHNANVIVRTIIGIVLILLAVALALAALFLAFLISRRLILNIIRLLFSWSHSKAIARWHFAISRDPKRIIDFFMYIIVGTALLKVASQNTLISVASIPESIKLD